MSCVTIQNIPGTECIGNSLVKINGNFEALATGLCELSANSTEAVQSASNLGTSSNGEGLYSTKVGSDLQFKRIKAGSNITLTSEANDVVISSDAGVTKLVAGSNITLSPADGTGQVTINAASGTAGTVTNVTGTAPITVTNGTTTPNVSVATATTGAQGVAEIATLAEVQSGTGTNTIVTPENLFTLLNTLSTNMINQLGNYPYLEYGWVTAPNAPAQTLSHNIFNTLTLNTEIADTNSLGVLAGNLVTLPAGTYRFEAEAVISTTQSFEGLVYFRLASGSQILGQDQVGDRIEQAALATSYMSGQFNLTSSSQISLQVRPYNLDSNDLLVGDRYFRSFAGWINDPSATEISRRVVLKLWKVG